MISNKTYTVDEALSRLQSYCAYQERCHKEVHQKLKSMNMIPLAIDEIIVKLIKQNYLNESRFAKTYVHGKLRIKKWGRHRLKRELKQRDVSSNIIRLTINDIDEQEYLSIFNALAEKKVASLTDTNLFKRKKKLTDYLLYRGWESALVYDKVNTLIRK
jgi:regulatory protein